jgi:serine/threonine protein kinase
VGEEPLRKAAGTPGYIAPEVNSGKPYDSKCDYWSLGVILFLLLAAELPFSHTDCGELLMLTRRGKYSFDGEVWNHVSAEAKDLVQGLLTVRPSLRYGSD